MTKQEFLAFSLPYGVKILWRDGETVILEPRIIRFIFDNNEYTKPILRPLSDLTKEIEHKGERFVPIKEIQKRNDFIHIMRGGFVIGVRSIYDLDELPTWVTQLLIKWHFDLFDGIKNEEAIDVNTLEVNPYK